MKYFYQQLYAFLAIVLITITVCGGIFYNFMENNIYTQMTQQLFGYASSIVRNQLDIGSLQDNLVLMKEDDIQLALFDHENTMTYPTTNFTFKSTLTDSELQHLQNGEPISVKQTNQSFTGEETDMLVVYYPVFKNRVYDGFLAIGSPLSRLQKELKELQQSIIFAFGIASSVGVGISFLFARYQNYRIDRLRKASHEIANGNFDIELPDEHRDEFDELASDFNKMAKSLRLSEQEIIRQENVRRQFMMDVAHELRTPLTTMNGLVEGLVHNMISESKRGRSLELIGNETQRLIRLVNENLDYEKIRSDQIVLVKQNFDGKEALQTVVDQLSDMAQKKENVLTLDTSSYFKVYADYDRFTQILVNLTKNAIQFTDHGTITLRGWEEEDISIVQVTDNGIGISPQEIESIWERYYKADVSRKSTKYGESGIGLAIVKSLVTLHGGSITVDSQLGGGTTFTVTFPKQG